MYPAVLPYLRCPVCRAGLAVAETGRAGTAPRTAPRATAAGAVLRCPSGHSFDVARHGYVDLTGGRATHPGDTAEMVAARAALLNAGHYRPLAQAIVAAAAPAAPPGLVVEVGAGTGYYLAALLDARPAEVGLAVDVSKPALRRAATAHPRVSAVRADVWRGLPLADGTASLLLDAFAPRSGAEFHRVLRADGALLVVTPTAEHLRELVAAGGLLTVDPDKEERLAATLERWFSLTHSVRLDWPLRLARDEAHALVAMGPSAWHAAPASIAAALAPLGEPVALTASVRLTLWHPRPIPDAARGGPGEPARSSVPARRS